VETILNFFRENAAPLNGEKLLILGGVLLAALAVNRLGIFLVNKYLAQPEEGPLGREVTGSLVFAARTFLNYGLLFAVLVVLLEVFQVRVVGPEQLRLMGAALFKVIGILLLAQVALRLGRSFSNYLLLGEKQKPLLNESRRRTLSSLVNSIIVYGVYFLAGTMLLETFGVRTGSILAGVGVVGLALSFGAQNLVRDVISGFFIIFEDQYNVGEVVRIDSVTGVVEKLELRTTQLREWTGQLHTIPNGEVRMVANFNRGEMAAVVLLGIAYEEDIDRAMEVLREEGLKAQEELEAITQEPIIHGVTELGDSHVGLRVVIKTQPGEQWGIEREMRKRYKQALDRAGIEIPYPRRVTIIKKDREDPDQGPGRS